MKIAEIQLSYHPVEIHPTAIRSSKDACLLFRNFWDENRISLQEEFKVLFLNRANRVLGILDLSKGGTSGTVVDPKILFAASLKAGAHGIILGHNHPSGNLKPSQADLELTQKISQGARYLDIHLLDHIILSRDGYLSFADESLLP